MKQETTYGFYTEEYENLSPIKTIMTGDGKTQFTVLTYAEDGKTALGIGYGYGTGVIGGTVKNPGDWNHESIGVKWQIKFEKAASIDALISTLYEIRDIQTTLNSDVCTLPENPEIVELKAALTLIMRAAEGAKVNCDSNPESPDAIRNGALASIAAVAAQGLGLLKGPKLSEGV